MALVTSMDSVFSHAIIVSLGLAPRDVKRLVIDCDADSPIMIYAELYGSERTLSVESPNLSECKVAILGGKR